MSYVNSNYYKAGTWNVICDVCGVQFKSDQVRKRWDGLIVCQGDFEHDHPQKHLRINEDKQAVAFVRSEPEDNFIDVCYLWERSAYADLATADCAIVGNTEQSYAFLYNLKNAGVVT
jgi:hypothetical protein